VETFLTAITACQIVMDVALKAKSADTPRVANRGRAKLLLSRGSNNCTDVVLPFGPRPYFAHVANTIVQETGTKSCRK
jgi:hypothetical protein